MKKFAFSLIFLLTFSLFTVAADEKVQDELLEIGGGKIRVALDPKITVSKPEALEWVRRAATAVSQFLGSFPVKNVFIQVEAGGRHAVNGGVTYHGSRINVRLGAATTVADLNQDWILTHEMFHLAFPTLPDDQLWMMEGLSDYLEPIARAQAGQLSASAVWKEMVDGMPQGLPEAGDRGLDNTHTWARTYWGGDIYWLLADAQIRVKTNNHRGVRDVIRAILKQGGNGGADWPLARVLEVGDKATGTSVLKDLHDQLGNKPGDVNLPELWQKLGVVDHENRIHFDDSAPWAATRRAITER